MPLYPPQAPISADYLVGTADSTLTAEIAVGTTPGGELGGTWASPTVDATHSGSAHLSGASAGGDLAGTYPNPTVAQSSTAFAFTGVISPTQLSATTNDWAPTGIAAAAVINVDINADLTLNGLSGGTDGRVIFLRNITTSILSLAHDAAASTAAMRFYTMGGGTYQIRSRGSVLIQYSAALSRWQVGGQQFVGSATPQAVGTAGAGNAVIASRENHIHATGAGTPSTQAFGDAAAVGSGPAAPMTDHKHAMPALGFGLSGTSTAVVSLTTASAYATATTSVSAATYADITGVSVSLVAGTWFVIGVVTGSVVNAHAIMNIALTHSDNTIISEQSGAIPASGSASVASNGSVTVVGTVTPGSTTTYKLRAARGNTTLTTTWTVMDGAGTGTTNNLTDGSDKGTCIFAWRVA